MDIEPALNQSGTIQEAIAQWKAYGITTVKQISSFSSTKDINGIKGNNAIRYVYTEDNGWIDLAHYAGVQVYGKFLMDGLESASGNKLLQKYIFGETADKSYFSYEDLPSNEFSSQVDIDGLEGDELFDAILSHFESAGATDPQEAPNYDQIPSDDQKRSRLPEKEETVFDDSSPSRTSKKRTPDKSKLKTGKYIPQNKTSKPYNLDNFDPANTSRERNRHGDAGQAGGGV
ncbi:hypothetical protein [Aquimarina megaterium]|uniref:hypothetical protein n=1 Tax=Aquimarina megaterium TaxID=1443666 RepID=UPI00046FE456|nr:hypothetical protein [Aquimarina megaterium]